MKDKSDLEKHIELYARGELASKFSLDIVDKYAFPINGKDPGRSIADYIKKKVSV